jgi:hypothetical protein
MQFTEYGAEYVDMHTGYTGAHRLFVGGRIGCGEGVEESGRLRACSVRR